MRIKKLITANLKFFYFFSIIFFFIFYLRLHKYGLPYFVNNDEIAGMKNLLYFYGFFSYANQNIVEPVVVKEQIIKSATEAASMILRIDDVIAISGGSGGGMPPGMPPMG